MARKKLNRVQKVIRKFLRYIKSRSFIFLLIKLGIVLLLSVLYVNFLNVKKNDSTKLYEQIFPSKIDGVNQRFPDMRIILQEVMENIPSGSPVMGTVTSGFGWRNDVWGGQWKEFHSGEDILAPAGTLLKTTASGIVIFSGWLGGYGYLVRIQHKYGFETWYAHCTSILVQSGQSVYRGQKIATLGHTGNATGNHCHYEIRYSVAVDKNELQNFLVIKK